MSFTPNSEKGGDKISNQELLVGQTGGGGGGGDSNSELTGGFFGDSQPQAPANQGEGGQQQENLFSSGQQQVHQGGISLLSSGQQQRLQGGTNLFSTGSGQQQGSQGGTGLLSGARLEWCQAPSLFTGGQQSGRGPVSRQGGGLFSPEGGFFSQPRPRGGVSWLPQQSQSQNAGGNQPRAYFDSSGTSNQMQTPGPSDINEQMLGIQRQMMEEIGRHQQQMMSYTHEMNRLILTQPRSTSTDAEDQVSSNSSPPTAPQETMNNQQSGLSRSPTNNQRSRSWRFSNDDSSAIRFDIGSFVSSDKSDPLVSFLLKPTSEMEVTQKVLNHLRQKVKQEGASRYKAFEYQRDSNVFSSKQLTILCDFLDFVWYTKATKDQLDARVEMSNGLLHILLASGEKRNENEVHRLIDLLGSLHPSGHPKIVLRRTQGPTQACISFHCDVQNSTHTCQIALNPESEYSGGKLCFFAKDTLTIPDRPPGSFTRHSRDILHAVTSVRCGVRKSLFLLSPHSNLGDRVIEVSPQDVQDFCHSNHLPIRSETGQEI